MPIRLEVFGEYACFTRPENKVERVSYEVMTPSAARGVLEAIMWHPGLKWVIDRIYVLNPIKFTNIRRNEVVNKISAENVRAAINGSGKPLYISTKADIQQRAAMVLTDVRYVIEAHFEMTEKATSSDNEGKFCEMMRRRASNGQCYHQPYFGTREFPAKFRPWTQGEIKTAHNDEERDLGIMLYDMDYADKENIKPIFFKAKLDHGVLDLRGCEVLR